MNKRNGPVNRRYLGPRSTSPAHQPAETTRYDGGSGRRACELRIKRKMTHTVTPTLNATPIFSIRENWCCVTGRRCCGAQSWHARPARSQCPSLHSQFRHKRVFLENKIFRNKSMNNSSALWNNVDPMKGRGWANALCSQQWPCSEALRGPCSAPRCGALGWRVPTQRQAAHTSISVQAPSSDRHTSAST